SARQQNAVPLLLERWPAAFDRIVLAVIRWIVQQVDFQTRPVRKFAQTFEKLCPRPRVLGPVIQIDRQSPDLWESVSHALPPDAQAVAPEVAGFMMTKDQCQRAGQQNQHTKRNQLL